jgi:hypothetical protein
MRKVVFVVAIVAASLVAGCSSLETSYNVMTFQKAEHSGITKGQRFLVYPLGEAGFFGREHLPPLLHNYNDTEFQKKVNYCTAPRMQKERIAVPFAGLPSVITSAGQLLYEEVFNEIEAKAKRIAKQSVHESSAVITWAPENNNKSWRAMRCLLMARLTDLDGDEQEDEIGMLAIIDRQDVGPKSSVLRPIYFRLNNSVAITGSSERPKLKVGMAFTVKAVIKSRDTKSNDNSDNKDKAMVDKLADIGAVALASDIPAVIGNKTSVCSSKGVLFHPAQLCPVSSELFLDPPPEASAIQLAVVVRETGSAAKIDTDISESTKALKSLTKPVFDAFLEQLAQAAKGNGGK